jgi:hypothetical protein
MAEAGLIVRRSPGSEPRLAEAGDFDQKIKIGIGMASGSAEWRHRQLRSGVASSAAQA